MKASRRNNDIIQIDAGTHLDLELRGERARPRRAKPPRYDGPKWNSSHPISAFFDSLSVDEFLRKYWSRDCYHFQAKDEKRFDKYFSIESYLELVISRSLRPNAEKTAREAIVNSTRSTTVDVIRGIDQIDTQMNNLARQIEEFTGLQVVADVYFNHAKELIEGPWHWDSRDKFLIQFEGEGILEIYEPFAPLPLPQQSKSAYPQLSESDFKLVDRIYRKKGDVIYIPRGVPHRHSLGKGTSIHAPFWLSVTTWYNVIEDLLRNALLKCQKDLEFRRCFPSNLKGGEEMYFREIRKLVAKVARAVDPKLSGYFFDQNQMELERSDFSMLKELWHSLEGMNDLNEWSEFEVTRRKMHLRRHKGEVELSVGTKKIYFSKSYFRSLKFIFEAPRFRIGELARFQLGKKHRSELIMSLVEHCLIQLKS